MTPKKKAPVESGLDILSVVLPNSSGFTAFMQGPATNLLAQISTRSASPKARREENSKTAPEHSNIAVTVDEISGTTLVRKTNANIAITVDKIKGLGWKASTHKLLDALVIEFSKGNSLGQAPTQLKVSLDMNTYLEMLGKPNTKSSKDQLRKDLTEDLNTLYATSIDWKAEDNSSFLRTRIISSMGYQNNKLFENGRFTVTFAPDFGEYLCSSYLLNYSTALFRIPERNPHSYHLGRKLLVSYHMNAQRRNQGYDVISVQSLLKTCPEMPDKESIADRHYNSRIIKPFESALDSLANEGMICWEYCTANGNPLSDEQIRTFNFDTFCELFIKYTIFPNRSS